MIVPAKGVQIYECRAKKDQGDEHTAREYRGRRGAYRRLFSSRGRDAGSDQLPADYYFFITK